MTDQILSISPVTGGEVGSVRTHSPEDVLEAVRKARDAAKSWKKTGLKRRVRYLSRLRSLILDQKEQIIETIVKETGKPRTEALTGDLMICLEFLKYYETHALEVLKPEARSTPLMMFGQKSEVERRPYGVVAMICPWNYPLQLTLIPAITALVAGNSVVLKPSEYTPLTGRLAGQLLRKAGEVEHLTTVVQGGAEVGQQLIASGPDKIFFTGSVSTGKRIQKQAAEQMIPVHLEMGGKDPMIVLDDANVNRAAKAAAWGAFCNAGQVCISTERAYVQEAVYDRFLTELLEETGGITVGSGPDADIGPLINPDQVQIVKEQVHQAVASGATLQTDPAFDDQFVEPIVLTDVTQDMTIMQDETFGPVLPVMAVSSDREAVRLANDSRYGLDASVFSEDYERARTIAGAIDTGACHINNVITNVGNPDLPFGGKKESGRGRYHGPEGLEAFTQTTSIMIDRWHGEGEPNWFPYSEELYNLLSIILEIRFAEEPFPRKFRRVVDLIKKVLYGELL